MDSNTAKKILQSMTKGVSKEGAVVALFEKVRDIPYGDIGSRDPYDVYKNNMGTCSGKHELLKALYHELGLKTRDFIAMHAFNDLPVKYPDDIKGILKRNEILDPHNFFKVSINKKWITVDVTWDMPLKRLAFPVNEHWNGRSDMEVSVVARRIFEVSDPIESKKREIAKLPESMQDRGSSFSRK